MSATHRHQRTRGRPQVRDLEHMTPHKTRPQECEILRCCGRVRQERRGRLAASSELWSNENRLVARGFRRQRLAVVVRRVALVVISPARSRQVVRRRLLSRAYHWPV